jgi:tetratricopeptide (TPR) repeat protein
MMQVSHQEMKEYLLKMSSRDISMRMKKLKDEDPVYKLFFQIIDTLKEKASITNQDLNADNIPFSEVEEMILNVLSNSINQRDAGRVLHAVYYSEANYQRLLIKVKQLAPALSAEPVPELVGVSIKSDDEIVADILNMPVRKGEKEGIGNIVDLLWNKIKNISLQGNKLYPRYALAFIVLIVITISIRFAIYTYNTSYQVLKARDLMESNYKVYMKDTPRLSGEYRSTGISTLLSGEDDNESYLDQALQYIEIALKNDIKSNQAKLLQAQIFIIKNEYIKADSVFKQIEETTASFFNDQGVLKYVNDDLKSAAKYFMLSTDKDKNFKEAYYNLALTKFRSGDKKEALHHLKQYLLLETDEGWRNAAANLINELDTIE